MVVTLMLVGVGCFMAGFGIAIILCAAKDNVKIEKEIMRNKNYCCTKDKNKDLEKKKKFLIGSELMRYGRNVKPDDIWEGLGV